ncbi:siroheme synthase CysG [Allomesorhizobium camelthorni]|uniref:Uroporphyrinogen-III C-methyltransferase n=1 Tax=Allomesorhizobium camelthorni TaxID=475069 RepID=A0A6G4WLQ4_9HYPH|nr:siroheme synthase CysG [Mesorhizobium camelthorni]NGO55745.1 uroporphyrinogen-III C-methyltransferase [Mesorhizobium camelthorni]
MQVVSRQPNEAAPARIQPLAVLPVFLDLTGKRAVVAGGSDGAAWKAELLAAAGARVEVYALTADLSEEMRRIVGRESAIILLERTWRPADLSGAAVALADAGDDREAAAFEAASRAAGAACNVIDKRAFCHFQFGSIVNRSPVVVGVSTAGAAPILGQAIRRRIETLLPPALAKWAALARDLRDRVAETLAPGARRRAFWEKLVDRAFGPAPTVVSEAELREAVMLGSAGEPRGHVTFVGAGPGDGELLTLKAVRALQAADVILFDDLVSDEVLELARREAQRILVGKRAGRPSCKQDEINEMMVSLAKAGRRVVRLKSGDPMIFGRAGEEIEALVREEIGYDVVPGITAGLAMASALGVSLTHRDSAKSVRFVTGHSRRGGLPEDMDWRAIADPSATTIFYMGGRTAGEIASRLIAHGMPGSTPVVVAADIGRAGQQIRTGCLSVLMDVPSEPAGSKPVLIGIGNVFGPHAKKCVVAHQGTSRSAA